jgi:hypothetical protein
MFGAMTANKGYILTLLRFEFSYIYLKFLVDQIVIEIYFIAESCQWLFV